ncbi:response regulator transcription factor [Kitasatospora sp. NPDC086791]|uniref:response regulator transcription factor n=1 Tax=Kitasatospora sp. NPDC086791 TaxID=3155178 RepID=UPI00341878BD
MTDAATVRVLLADDEHLIRGALAALLSLEDDIEVVAQAGSGPEALAMARSHRPDVAVLDLQMRPRPEGREVPPGLDGIEVAAELRRVLPDCRCMIVTGHGRPGYLKRALEVGVRAFLPKTVSAADLAGIIRTVRSGGRYVDPELAADAISAGETPLTPRETDVLELAADGTPIAEIAARAALSQGTVRNYLSSAAGKLGAENRHAAVRIAREHGWI